MNKAQLIEAMASEAKITKAAAKVALDAFVSATTKALKKGERVALVGFGSFGVAKRAAEKEEIHRLVKKLKLLPRKW
jgi:DNA-binding protein HU-beta